MRSKVDDQTKATLKRIGTALRQARQAAGLSQVRLAHAISMDRENYAKIERAEINVTIDTLVRIADGLGTRLIVEFSSEPSRRPRSSETSASSTRSTASRVSSARGQAATSSRAERARRSRDRSA